MLDFEFVWSVAEHARAQHVILVRRMATEGRTLLFMIPLGLLVIGLGLAGWRAIQGDPEYLAALLPVALIFAISSWVFFWGRGWLAGWHQRRNDSSLQYPIHHVFSEHGLRVRGRSAEVTLGWRSMPAIIETPDFILFYYTGSAAHYLPKRVADAGQLDELRTLIRANSRDARLTP